MKSGIERILANIGLKNIIEILSSNKITWGDFHTLLLNIFDKKIKDINPAEIMRNYKENRFSVIADVNPKELLEIDKILYSVIPAHFSLVELSPVSVMGANAILTSLNPKIVLSTIRNVEVVGDPSMALTIECAHRRKSLRTTKKDIETHLATSHRVLRLQAFPKDSNLTAHFRTFALVSGARDIIGFNKFELSTLSIHIETWLNFLAQSANHRYKTQNVSVAISNIRIMEKLILDGKVNKNELVSKTKDKTFNPFKVYSINLPEQVDHALNIPISYPELETYINELRFTEKQIIESLRIKYPDVKFYFDLNRKSGIGYYSGLCYKITADNLIGQNYSLAGGGACDWTRKLLNNKREHLIASGFGTEFFNKMFKSN